MNPHVTAVTAYGRQRTHALRPCHHKLLDMTLPRLALSAFAPPVTQARLGVCFGRGEHNRA